jgi:hypothetical protein
MSAILAAAPVAAAQTITAQASVEKAVVGEWFTVQVEVNNPRTPAAPQPGATRDFEIRIATQNPTPMHQSFNINGVISRYVTYTYVFEVRPLRFGGLTIPAFVVNDGQEVLRSSPIPLSVEDADAAPYLLTEITTEPVDRAYVGQEIRLVMNIWVRKFRQGRWELDAAILWTHFRDGRATSMGAFTDAGQPRFREATRPDRDGRKVGYFVYQLETSIRPTKPGPLDLGDVQIAFLYPVRLARDVFGQLSFDGAPRRLRHRPEPPKLEVLPIPQAGRPPDFNGAVGSYTVSARAKPTEVPVGDPITLTLILRGEGSLDRLAPPRLDRVEALVRDFEVSGESPAGEVTGNAKQFSLTIRPLREDIAAIPPLPMSAFDPTTGRFVTSMTDPIPIKVTAAQRVALSNVQQGGGPLGEGAFVPLVETTDGLLPNDVNADRLLAASGDAMGRAGLGVLAGLPAVYLAAWLVHVRAARFRDDRALRRRHGAYRAARRMLQAVDGATDPGRVRAALLSYIADRCNVPAAGLTRAEAVALATRRHLPAETVQALDRLLEKLEMAQYGQLPTEAGQNGTQAAEELLTALEHCRFQ